MTFDDYIKNPMGSKTTVMTNLTMYKILYNNKWDQLMVRENGKVNYRLYMDENNDAYFAHFKIPSEVVVNFYYDTIVRFYMKDKKSRGISRSLSKYDVQFYSNDPNFVFTFAHAFKKKEMLIKDLEPKMSKLAIKEKAVAKNPNDELGYVKSLYFLYLAMKSLNLFSKQIWDISGKKYDKLIWKNTVVHADDKIQKRQELGAKVKKQEKKQTVQPNQPKHSIFNPNSINTHTMESNSKSGFGHFKKSDYSPMASIKNGIKNSISRNTFNKKPFK